MKSFGLLMRRVVVIAVFASGTVFANPVGTMFALPQPDPFTLNGYDTIQAVSVLHRAGLIRVVGENNRPRTVAVRDVYAVLVGVDEHAAPAYRLRYDIILNGEPLAWERTYVEYGGRMVNMKLLFTYRNQAPPSSVPYHIE